MIDNNKFFAEKLKYSTEYAINFDEAIIYIYSELEHNLGTFLRVRYDLIQMWYDNVFETPLREITLDISSYGGDIYSINGALDFSHHLKERGILVNTRAQGVCMSAATLLLAAGTGVRSSHPSTKFMLHDIQIDGGIVEGTGNQVRHTAKTISDEQLEFFSYYAQFSRKNLEPLNEKDLIKEGKKWLKKYSKDSIDHYFDAKIMLELKLIDKIL